ncbi:hypothetical protein Tco_0207019 [Tanacetum coccineum]
MKVVNWLMDSQANLMWLLFGSGKSSRGSGGGWDWCGKVVLCWELSLSGNIRDDVEDDGDVFGVGDISMLCLVQGMIVIVWWDVDVRDNGKLLLLSTIVVMWLELCGDVGCACGRGVGECFDLPLESPLGYDAYHGLNKSILAVTEQSSGRVVMFADDASVSTGVS